MAGLVPAIHDCHAREGAITHRRGYWIARSSRAMTMEN